MTAPPSAIIVYRKTVKTEGKLNMTLDPELESLDLRVVRIVYQTYTRFQNRLDEILAPQGLTTERYFVLLAIKNHEGTARVTDIAHWAERRINSVSTIVDRMVRDGLLRRVRDRRDRRAVNVSMTAKADTLLTSANIASVEFIGKVMSPLSRDDAHTLISLFVRINYKLLESLNPEADIEGILKDDSDLHDRLVKKMAEQRALTTP
jgi:DNA-binding MarR family transcriptional regulator